MGRVVLILIIFIFSALTQSVEVEKHIYLPPEPFMVVELPEYIPLHRISAYNAVPRQTEGNPNVSSCGPNLERQIAVSRDLFFDEHGRKHLCGTTVTVVTNQGEVFADYVIWDTMAPRFTNTADILFPGTDETMAYAFGIRESGILLFHD